MGRAEVATHFSDLDSISAAKAGGFLAVTGFWLMAVGVDECHAGFEIAKDAAGGAASRGDSCGYC